MFDIRASVTLGQVAEQGDLALGSSGEVGVAAFRWRRNEPPVDVVDERFSQPGSRSDQRDVAAISCLPGLKRVKLGWRQLRDAVRHGLQIVDDEHTPKTESIGDQMTVDAPRHVRQSGGSADHWTSGAEAGR